MGEWASLKVGEKNRFPRCRVGNGVSPFCLGISKWNNEGVVPYDNTYETGIDVIW